MTRLRLAAVSALAVSALVAGGSPLPQASAHPPAAKVELTPLGSYSTGAFDEGGSEIVAYDSKRHRAFSVNAQAGTVDVLDISDPTAPAKVATLATPGANSVSVQGRTIAGRGQDRARHRCALRRRHAPARQAHRSGLAS